MSVLADIVSFASTALSWAHGNLWAIVAGFAARHVSPAVLAKAQALLKTAHDKVQALVDAVKAKL